MDERAENCRSKVMLNWRRSKDPMCIQRKFENFSWNHININQLSSPFPSSNIFDYVTQMTTIRLLNKLFCMREGKEDDFLLFIVNLAGSRSKIAPKMTCSTQCRSFHLCRPWENWDDFIGATKFSDMTQEWMSNAATVCVRWQLTHWLWFATRIFKWSDCL